MRIQKNTAFVKRYFSRPAFYMKISSTTINQNIP